MTSEGETKITRELHLDNDLEVHHLTESIEKPELVYD